MGTVLTKRKSSTKHRTPKHRGGGGAGSKPKRPSVPKPVPAAEPIKRVVLFDLDGTLLFRTEVSGIWSLQQERMRKGLALPGETIAITADKVRPRPDIIFPELQEIVYVRRPGKCPYVHSFFQSRICNDTRRHRREGQQSI